MTRDEVLVYAAHHWEVAALGLGVKLHGRDRLIRALQEQVRELGGVPQSHAPTLTCDILHRRIGELEAALLATRPTGMQASRENWGTP